MTPPAPAHLRRYADMRIGWIGVNGGLNLYGNDFLPTEPMRIIKCGYADRADRGTWKSALIGEIFAKGVQTIPNPTT